MEHDMTKKIGLKEAALKLMREGTTDIPMFLKREETPEQAEKRRFNWWAEGDRAC
jgi:hypothetical protein